MDKTLNILFIGDIVGNPGRKAVSDFLLNDLSKYNVKKDNTFIIANVENASHGFGLTEKNYNELKNLGIDCFTSGNHIWDKKEIWNYIQTADILVRPLNYPENTAGQGLRIFEKNGLKIAVMNLLGRVFMSPIDSPWDCLEKEIEKIKKITPIIIIDFHAEATAEKICFAKFAQSLGVSVLVGTHTHVQTADEQIINNSTAYISDVGFCGSSCGVIGMNYEDSLYRLRSGLPNRFEIAEPSATEVNAVYIEINPVSGKAHSIKRLIHRYIVSEDIIMTKG